MSAGLGGDAETGLGRVADQGGDVGRVRGFDDGDHRLIDGQIPRAAGMIEVGVARQPDLAGDGAPQTSSGPVEVETDVPGLDIFGDSLHGKL